MACRARVLHHVPDVIKGAPGVASSLVLGGDGQVMGGLLGMVEQADLV